MSGRSVADGFARIPARKAVSFRVLDLTLVQKLATLSQPTICKELVSAALQAAQPKSITAADFGIY